MIDNKTVSEKGKNHNKEHIEIGLKVDIHQLGQEIQQMIRVRQTDIHDRMGLFIETWFTSDNFEKLLQRELTMEIEKQVSQTVQVLVKNRYGYEIRLKAERIVDAAMRAAKEQT